MIQWDAWEIYYGAKTEFEWLWMQFTDQKNALNKSSWKEGPGEHMSETECSRQISVVPHQTNQAISDECGLR